MGTKPELYGPAEVCLAAGVPRATFHSWISRRYLTLAPGPGMGRAREFTLIEAVRIAAVAHLNRLGIAVGVAADCCEAITDEHQAEPQIMVMFEAPPDKEGRPSKARLPRVRMFTHTQFQALIEHSREVGTSPAFATVYVSEVANRVREALQNPFAKHRANSRIESSWEGATGEKVFVQVPVAIEPKKKGKKRASKSI